MTVMIPVGYMAKFIATRPEWLKADHVCDVYSVSHCVSHDFADYLNYWKHNGYWFFDSPEIIREIAREHSLKLSHTSLLYYEVFEHEFYGEKNEWKPFSPEMSCPINVIEPETRILKGYDVVTFSARTSPECSPLSCNSLASNIEVNQYCLLPSFELAKQLLREGKFKHTEPGPYRIFAVYSVPWA